MRGIIALSVGMYRPHRTEIFPPKEKRQSLCRVCFRAADARRGGHDSATRGLAPAGRRNCPQSRRTADCGRSDDRLCEVWNFTIGNRQSAIGNLVCQPPRRRAAGFPLPRQGPDRRLSADGRNSDYAENLRCISWRVRRVKTFFHGHSFTGNQLGAAASLASLEILQSPDSMRARDGLEKHLAEALKTLWQLPNVGDIRQVGLIAGIELVKNWRMREPYALRERAGIRVCEAMARTRRAHAPGWQCNCADAAVLHHPNATKSNGFSFACCGNRNLSAPIARNAGRVSPSPRLTGAEGSNGERIPRIIRALNP